MELISSALQAKGVDTAIKAANSLLARLCGPAFDELGGMFGDWFHRKRFQLALKGLGKAQEMIRDAGIDPKRVPLKVLSPILDGMSLEEDDELAVRWAALLANAARSPTLVRPGFTHILSDLSHNDAQLLDYMVKTYPRTYKNGWDLDSEEWSASYAQVLQVFEGDEDELRLSLSNLQRLGLIEQDAPYVRTVGTLMGQIGPFELSLRASAIGREFYAACQPPEGMTVQEETVL
jgi:hypothetical protein